MHLDFVPVLRLVLDGSQIRGLCITCKGCALLAHHFGASYRAGVYRLKSLRYLSDRETGLLLEQERHGRNYLEALGMFGDIGKFQEQRYRDRELRNEVAHLAIEAYRRGEVSRDRVLEPSKTLRITGDILFNLAEAARER